DGPHALPRLRAPRRPPARGAHGNAPVARPTPSPCRPRRAHRRPRGAVERRMRRLIAVVALTAAVGGCGSSPAPHGFSLEIDRSPFRVSVLENGKTVVAENEDARLRYQLASTGAVHELTNVTSAKGSVYQVATDEAGRTATVTVATTATGARLQLVLHPAT